MTVDEARHVLGVTREATAADVRAAYLRLVRANHPDVAADPVTAGPITAAITEAYRVLRALPPLPRPEAAREKRPFGDIRAQVREGREVRGVRKGPVEVISAEAVWVDASPAETFRAAAEAADQLGEVSYVDRSAALIQVAVRPEGGPTCWLTVSLHRRPGGTVAVCTLESIEAAPTPPAGPVIRTFADFLDVGLGQSS